MKGKGLVVLALAGLAYWLWTRRQKTVPSAGQGNVEAYSGIAPKKKALWNTSQSMGFTGKVFRLNPE